MVHAIYNILHPRCRIRNPAVKFPGSRNNLGSPSPARRRWQRCCKPKLQPSVVCSSGRFWCARFPWPGGQCLAGAGSARRTVDANKFRPVARDTRHRRRLLRHLQTAPRVFGRQPAARPLFRFRNRHRVSMPFVMNQLMIQFRGQGTIIQGGAPEVHLNLRFNFRFLPIRRLERWSA